MALNRTLWPTRQWRGKLAAGCVIVGAAVASVCATLTPAAAQTTPSAVHLHQAVELGLPPNITNGFDWALAASCSRAGSCTAGGLYEAPPSGQAMAVTESHGSWGTPHRVVMPPDAPANPDAEILAVSCTGPGNCVGVGNYFVGQSQAFVAVQSHGAWTRARRIALPADAAAISISVLHSVACTAPGSCVAVGQYKDDFGHFQAMQVTATNGKWRQAAKLRLPVNAGHDPKAALQSISCVKAGSCLAVGYYTDTGGNMQALTMNESGGKWQRGVQVKLPGNAATNPLAALVSVSCPQAGACLTIGAYQNQSAMAVPIVATRSADGLWRARPLTWVPADAAAQPNTFLGSVACPKPGSCVAVGGYKQSSGAFAAMIVTESAGKWTGAARIHLPSDAVVAGQTAAARAATCISTGYCLVVGMFRTATGDRGFAASIQ